MKTRDTFLIEIANTLFVNAQHLPVMGLFNGQLGVALFFYQYARHSGHQFYSSYSDDVMDAVIESIHVNTSRDFGDGLAGIGWAIDYLMKNGFVETDNDIFEDVDVAIEKMSLEDVVAELDGDDPVFSKGFYAVFRNKREVIAECVGQCEELLDRKERRLPPGYLNSILHFLTRAHEMGIETSRCETMQRKVFARIGPMLEKKRYEESELIVLRLLIERISGLMPELTLEIPVEIDPEAIIRACWSEHVYGFSFAGEIDTDNIDDFIDRAMLNIEEKNLAFFGGLTALGLSLIRLSHTK